MISKFDVVFLLIFVPFMFVYTVLVSCIVNVVIHLRASYNHVRLHFSVLWEIIMQYVGGKESCQKAVIVQLVPGMTASVQCGFLPPSTTHDLTKNKIYYIPAC